jgi:hypothetical protein
LMETVCNREDGPTDSFDYELAKLRHLELEAMYLHAKIHAQKEVLRTLIDDDDEEKKKSLKEQLAKCSSFKCYAKTLLKSAKSTAKAFIHKITHHSRRDSIPPQDMWINHMEIPNHQAKVLAASSKGGSSSSSTTVRCKGAEPLITKTKHFHEDMDVFHQDLMRKPTVSPFIISFKIVSAVTILIAIIFMLHRACSPRRRAERRALREERRNQRAYRRAARVQACRQWWQSRRTWIDQMRANRRRAPMDYEEKRAIVMHQEEILESAMQEEIRQLRDAHSTVNSLVASSSPVPRTIYTPPTSRDSETTSLPDYRSDSENTDPPAYESEDEASTYVSNGFRQYTPSPSSPTVSESPSSRAGSSIIEVSPRPSAETMRTCGTVETC